MVQGTELGGIQIVQVGHAPYVCIPVHRQAVHSHMQAKSYCSLGKHQIPYTKPLHKATFKCK